MIGNSGKNVLDSGSGNDPLNGGYGTDTLNGRAGSDRFDFNLASELGDDDLIIGFERGAGGDVLDISDLLNDVGYLGSDVFGDGYLSLTVNGANTDVMFDTDGGGDNAVLLASLLNVELTSSHLENFAFNYTV
jgi:Ca2+-binding RTX toxin-like protein